VVFCLAGVNAARVVVTLTGWDYWTAFDLPFPLSLHVALGCGWAAALGGTAWGLWTTRRWSRRWALVLIPLYQLYELGWRLAFTRGEYERGRLPFVLVTLIIGTAIAIWILTRRRVKHVFEWTGSTPEETDV
jgi:hypothetical protein